MATNLNFFKTTYNAPGAQAKIDIINPSNRFLTSIMADPTTKYTLEYKISNDAAAGWRTDDKLVNLVGNHTLDTFANLFEFRINIIELTVGVLDIEVQIYG